VSWDLLDSLSQQHRPPQMRLLCPSYCRPSGFGIADCTHPSHSDIVGSGIADLDHTVVDSFLRFQLAYHVHQPCCHSSPYDIAIRFSPIPPIPPMSPKQPPLPIPRPPKPLAPLPKPPRCGMLNFPPVRRASMSPLFEGLLGSEYREVKWG